MKRNGHYWTEQDKAELEAAQSFLELAVIALRVLERMPQPVVEVCGPISTGGYGSIEKNLAAFTATIDYLSAQGHNVFDQVPFEVPMFRIRAAQPNSQLLEEFYLPVFESGLVSILYFMPDWQSSKGANWEHTQAQRLGLQIVYLEPNLVQV